MLQSKAGYIDARPHIRQLDEILLQRTAGPYIGSIASEVVRSLGRAMSGMAPGCVKTLWGEVIRAL
jgi:hypothetical protein